MAAITIREHARLTFENGHSSIDLATISASAFDWLQDQMSGLLRGRVIFLEGPRVIRVGSFVGVIETPCGTQIEILPKTVQQGEDVVTARKNLVAMIVQAMRVSPRAANLTQVEAFKLPITEWLIREFLQSTASLLKRGLRQSYSRTEANERFLRGRLQAHKQVGHGPARAHIFAIEYDVFDFNRPENRLVRSALDRVLASTRNLANWRLARELSIMLSEIPPSSDVLGDFQRWGRDRLLAHYADTRGWCELILHGLTPFAVSGRTRGISMLFPMERLFEEFVTNSMRRRLPRGFSLRAQSADRFLCTYGGNGCFSLKPDIIVSNGSAKWIIDAKWKILSDSLDQQFGSSQSDFYQLFAYGQHYLDGVGDLFLIYPKTTAFVKTLGPFVMPNALRLYLVPFDLHSQNAPLPFLPNDGLSQNCE